MSSRSIVAALAFLLVASTAAAAEQVAYLLDGSVLRGELVLVKDDAVVLKSSMGELTIAKDKLQRIEFAPEAVKAEAPKADPAPKSAAAAPVTTKLPPFNGEVRATTNPDVVRGCAYVGTVSATSGWGGGMAAYGASNVEKALKKKTAEKGGNVVHITTSGTHGSGEAYFCEAPK